ATGGGAKTAWLKDTEGYILAGGQRLCHPSAAPGRRCGRSCFVLRPLYFLTLFVLLIGYAVMPGRASSHREAPLISNDPQADNTDVYAFMAPDNPDLVTFVASFIPFEDPAGGPNFYRFGDNVLYEIK